MKNPELSVSIRTLEEIDDICLSIVDKNGKYTCYSKGCELIDGFKKENVIGKDPDELFRIPKGKDTKISKSLILGTLKSGKPYKNFMNTYETKKGTSITALCNTYPIFSENGDVESVICTYREISDYLNLISTLNKQNLELKNISKVSFSNNTQYTFSSIIGKSPCLEKCIYQGQVAAETLEPVLLCGETGTGKELFAQSIHNASMKSQQNFVALNCATIPENLLESTLFGTCKGSYTGALNTKGLFSEAKGSTLFLDEINSMDIKLQSKLLRVLETGKFRKVGSTEELNCDVRIISALNEDPFKAIKNNNLRLDLYYRLAVFSINIPALRNRDDDVLILSKHFLNTMSPVLGKKINQLSPEVIDLFTSYSWPGNIRELHHILHQSICLSKNDDLVLKISNLPEYLSHALVSSSLPFTKESSGSLKAELDSYEEKLIRDALFLNHHNISKTALQLNISRQSLHHKINKYHLQLKE